MKTNAGQSLGYPLLRNITGGKASDGTRALARKDPARSARPKKSERWGTKVASFLRDKIAVLNACLAEFYRLSGQAASAAPCAAPTTVTLRKGEVVNLTRDYRAKRVQVLHGVVWLTGVPAQGDVLLFGGDQFSLVHGAIHVMQTLEDAILTLER